jgi:hypothetical protein
MPQIEVVVNSTGETQVHTKGFTGPACQAASRFVEQALGQVTQQNLTAEFYQGQITCSARETEGSGSSPAH